MKFFYLLYFATTTKIVGYPKYPPPYIVGTQKNHLMEMVLLSAHNICLLFEVICGKYNKGLDEDLRKRVEERVGGVGGAVEKGE